MRSQSASRLSHKYMATSLWRTTFRASSINSKCLHTQMKPCSIAAGQKSSKASRDCCSAQSPSKSTISTPSSIPLSEARFWTSKSTWSRAAVNTGRCLVGCTTGDFSLMWYLQSAFPELSMLTTMSASMAAGITTSIILETALLRWGKDSMPLKAAIRTATGMSMISMLAMEAAENAVDYHLTRGVVDLSSPHFWSSATLAVAAGFVVPLPYNYFRLRRYAKSCH